MELIYVSLVFQETSSKFFIYSGMHKKAMNCISNLIWSWKNLMRL